MKLQRACGNHGGNRPLHGLGNDLGLFLARGQQDASPALQDGAYAHGDRAARHRRALGEERLILRYGSGRQGLGTGTRIQCGHGLVETDMPRAADTEQLKIDAVAVRDLFLVMPAFRCDILGHSIGQMGVAQIDVHAMKQVFVHIEPVGVGVLRRQPHVFVQIECPDQRKIQSVVLVHARQLFVYRLHRAARGQAHHQIGLLHQRLRNECRGQGYCIFLRGSNNHFH